MVIKSSDNFKNYFIDKMFWNCRYALFVMTPFMAVCWKIDQINHGRTSKFFFLGPK